MTILKLPSGFVKSFANLRLFNEISIRTFYDAINLDMIGNRVAALTFGPKNVLIFVGRNKIVPDVDEAMFRIKNYVAPANVMRLEKKTPCLRTSYCEDCVGPDRICNTWTITEKSFPKGRVHVILINEELGL